ncbi:MAG: rRNA maturation RNAse YbeY, partial [Phycisphaerales bacterium]
MTETGPVRDAPPSPFVELLHEERITNEDARWIVETVRRLQALAAPGLSRLTVRLVDDAEMSRLHARHMNDPTTTDVLTFV